MHSLRLKLYSTGCYILSYYLSTRSSFHNWILLFFHINTAAFDSIMLAFITAGFSIPTNCCACFSNTHLLRLVDIAFGFYSLCAAAFRFSVIPSTTKLNQHCRICFSCFAFASLTILNKLAQFFLRSFFCSAFITKHC